MAYRLIGQDVAVQISLTAAAHAGGTPTYGAPTVIKGIARRVSIDDELQTEDVSALGDTREKIRGKRGRSTVEIEQLVYDTGWQYNLAGTGSKLGYAAKLEIKPLSTLTSFQVWQGLITRWSGEAPDGAQVERITITCDAD